MLLSSKDHFQEVLLTLWSCIPSGVGTGVSGAQLSSEILPSSDSHWCWGWPKCIQGPRCQWSISPYCIVWRHYNSRIRPTLSAQQWLKREPREALRGKPSILLFFLPGSMRNACPFLGAFHSLWGLLYLTTLCWSGQSQHSPVCPTSERQCISCWSAGVSPQVCVSSTAQQIRWEWDSIPAAKVQPRPTLNWRPSDVHHHTVLHLQCW